MALTYKPPLPENQPERILGIGAPGTGKTHALFTILEMLPDVRGHVVDTDESANWSRMIYGTSLQERVTVYRAEPDDWEAQLELTEEATAACKPGDWFGFDSMTHPWAAVQEWFIEQVQGTDIADYFMQVRMQKAEAKEKKKSLGALDGWMDWPVINKQYRKLLKIIRSCDGHVYLTAEAARVGDDDDKDVRLTFGPYGVKPAGQKRLGFFPHTAVLFSKSRSGEYALTTIKDRNRGELKPVELEDKKIESFGKDYLRDVAGWKAAMFHE